MGPSQRGLVDQSLETGAKRNVAVHRGFEKNL